MLAHGFDGFFAFAADEEDWATLVAEGAAHRAGEIFFVLVVKQILAVDKEQEGGRRLADLRGVKEFQAMAGGTDRLAVLDGVAQRAIENGGGHLLPQLRGNVADRFQQPVKLKTRLGGRENHRRIIEEKQ